ncbi:MAG: GTPase [Bdellovibrionales bacterium]
MRLKSFTGKTLSEAMQQVRDALGDDAIIIATRDADDGGVQVTAALDDETRVSVSPVSTADIPLALDAGLIEDDVLDQVSDALQRHGTPVHLAEAIVAHTARHFSGDLNTALAAGLQSVLQFADMPDSANKTLLLIGPPGAGKTAMIGRLAARAALAGRKCAAISTDLERAGGVAQLESYTSSMKMPLMEVEDARALKDAMDMHNGVDVMFIDSTGINPFDAKASAQTQEIIRAVSTADGGSANILVLPAGLEAMDASELATAFKNLGATYLIPTRLDLARRLGSLLAVAAESNLQLCAAATGPNIATGLEILTPQVLAARLLPQNPAQQQTTAAQKTATYGKR